jgi:pyrroloquinoline-quinone synthase
MLTSSATDPFVVELRDMVARKHANLNHPFVQELVAGRLTRDQLRLWALQRYKGITGMGLEHIGNLFVNAPDERVRKHVWHSLGEEGGYFEGTASHSQWLLSFGQALGLTREDFARVEPLPETIAINSFFLLKFDAGTFLEGFSALVCIESQNPSAFPRWTKALEEDYGIPRDALTWFYGHIEADSEDSGHAGEGWAIIREYASTEASRSLVRRTVKQALDVYWLSLDGILRAGAADAGR